MSRDFKFRAQPAWDHRSFGAFTGKDRMARSGSRLKAKLQRSIRRMLNREIHADEPQLNQPKKISNFWWSWW